MSETDLGFNSGSLYKNKQVFETSGQFVVPPNVYRLKYVLQGGGSSGWSTDGSGAFRAGDGGGAGGHVVGELDVVPGQIFKHVIGVGGVGFTPNSYQAGGTSTLSTGLKLVAIAFGGTIPRDAQGENGGMANGQKVLEWYRGGLGGVKNTSGTGSPGTPPRTIADGLYRSINEIGGAGGTGGGGGGGASPYGIGGQGGGNDQPGGNAPAKNYGAGGGGAGNSTQQRKGGDGQPGVAEYHW